MLQTHFGKFVARQVFGGDPFAGMFGGSGGGMNGGMPGMSFSSSSVGGMPGGAMGSLPGGFADLFGGGELCLRLLEGISGRLQDPN